MHKIKIDHIDENGNGVFYLNKRRYFLSKVNKDEEFLIQIIDRKPQIKKIIKKTKRVNPNCKHYFSCGGCNLLHMKYEDQIKLKQEIVEKYFNNENLNINKILFNENVNNYRSRTILPIQTDKNGIKIGYFRSNSNEIVDIDKCENDTKYLSDIIHLFKNEIKQEWLKDLKRITHLVIKVYDNENIALGLVLDEKSYDKYLCKGLISKLSDLDKINKIYKIKGTTSNRVMSNEKECLFNRELDEKFTILNKTFHSDITNFFQINRNMHELFFSNILQIIDPKSDDSILECYSGVGVIPILLSEKASKIVAIENSESSYIDYVKNIELNSATNIEFYKENVEDVFDRVVNEHKINKVVFNPPRTGLKKDIVENIKKWKISEIVYISCSMKTLKRDINKLSDEYRVEQFQPVDLFPNTHHIENIVKLVRK